MDYQIHRKKEEWETEARSKKVRQLYEVNEELKIQQAVKEEKKEIFDKNRKVSTHIYY